MSAPAEAAAMDATAPPAPVRSELAGRVLVLMIDRPDIAARIGHVRAFQMFATDEPVPAATALAWGLANRVVPAADLGAVALAAAERLARQPAGALAAAKALMSDVDAVRATMERESTEFRRRLASPEAQEAFAASAGCRKPDFDAVSAD